MYKETSEEYIKKILIKIFIHRCDCTEQIVRLGWEVDFSLCAFFKCFQFYEYSITISCM